MTVSQVREKRGTSRVIAFANQKGGVGKTTCVANVAVGLRRLGFGVLMIDLDPQAHLTASFGKEGEESPYSAQRILSGSVEAFNVVEMPRLTSVDGGPGLHLIPSGIELAAVEFEVAGQPGRETILKSYLENLKQFVVWDYVLIDCPPNLGVLTLNALTACKEVVIPMQAEFLPLRGVKGLLDTIELVKQRLNPGLEILGVVATRIDERKVLTRDVLGKIREYFGDRAFKTVIHENVSLAEAPSAGESIFDYAPESRGAEDFEALAKELSTRVDRGENGAKTAQDKR